MVAFKLLFRARDCWTHAALKLQSEHCNVAKGPNFNFQFVVPCLVLISSELRALSLSPNLNLQFEKACITLRSSSILCEVWLLTHCSCALCALTAYHHVPNVSSSLPMSRDVDTCTV